MRKFKLFAGVMALAVLMLASTSCGSEAGLLFITIIPEETTLTVSKQTVQFIANGVFERGPDQNITDQVTWASSQESVATISNNASDSKGLATAGPCPVTPTSANGTTTISASLKGKTATAELTVSISFCP
ncbi:MAG: hypothetical protein ACRD2Y_09315 [Terriglobales bacterium]